MTRGQRPDTVVTNQSMVLFSSAAGVDRISYSNTVNTPVLSPVLALHKSADKTSVSLGETLVYTLTATNNGNVAAQVVVTDALPPGVSFIANSVLRDGIPLPGVTPAAGIPLGTVAPHITVHIAFQVIVVSLPSSLQLRNTAVGRYIFTTLEGREVHGETRSNPVSISILSYQLSTLLTASTPTTFVGDAVTYTLLLKNEGTRPLAGINARIPVPDGAVFIPGSVVAGGVYDPESDPEAGIPLGNLGTGSAAEISFRVRITAGSDPVLITRAAITYYVEETETVESNTVSITVVHPGISVHLKVNYYSAAPGDSLHYVFTVKNSGNFAADAVLVDAVPQGTLFIWDSIRIDGAVQRGARPGDGVPLGTIRAGASVIVSLEVSIPATFNFQQLPAVQNHGNVQYTFTLPDGRSVRQVTRSNTVTTLILSPVISIEMTGEPPIVEPGGIAKFKIQVANSGNYPADVSVIRIIPQGTFIDPDIVTISAESVPGTSYRGAVQLGTVDPGQTVHLTYFVKINPGYLGHSIEGYSTALYLFTIDGRSYNGEARSNTYRLIIEEISE
ncbi:hypothetical protein C2I18_21340 [Paenibacillus sp. PK3_47]|uniref:DUF11 domain-containing protein n=1 Tax=Paenibacillus sp. PK3_47 TaxID=2072642 RepID=UPI00201DAA16|nr:DUF11 domain-containing protein [Paenibacillus sp. PK3_47]UQZ35850.1 hypothetical protein C2I18_21340 [Paenibacillus sp. PK3_47]